VAEPVRADDPPVVALGMARVVLRVDEDQVESGVDVALLVVDAQVEVEVRPVVGERVDDLSEAVGKGAHGRRRL
jgi:hypothetical protein